MEKTKRHPFILTASLLLLCLTLGTGSALANHRPGHMGYSHMGHMHAMGATWGKDMFAYVPMGIMFQKDLLGLSDEQVQKIRSLHKEMHSSGGNHDAAVKIHEQLESALEGGKLDLSTYESALKEAADFAVKNRLETARKAQEALQVLNEDQRTRFLYSMQVMHAWMEMHGSKHHKHGKHGKGMSESKSMSEGDMSEESDD